MTAHPSPRNAIGAHPPLGRRDRWWSNEDGSFSVAAVLIALALVSLGLAVLVHGLQLNALSATRETAANAARVGSQQVDLQTFFDAGDLQLNPGEARAAAAQYVAAAPNDNLVAIAIDADEITVTVSRIVPGQFGFGARTFTSTRSAVAARGVFDEEP